MDARWSKIGEHDWVLTAFGCSTSAGVSSSSLVDASWKPSGYADTLTRSLMISVLAMTTKVQVPTCRTCKDEAIKPCWTASGPDRFSSEAPFGPTDAQSDRPTSRVSATFCHPLGDPRAKVRGRIHSNLKPPHDHIRTNSYKLDRPVGGSRIRLGSMISQKVAVFVIHRSIHLVL